MQCMLYAGKIYIPVEGHNALIWVGFATLHAGCVGKPYIYEYLSQNAVREF